MFRFMEGRCVPMHPNGGCPGHRDPRDDDGKQVDCLYATTCPKCDAAVYFLRHNGGCTWLDDIPYPWPKHGCFLDQSDPIPEAWRVLAATSRNCIIVRLHTFSSYSLTATLTPVEKKHRKWFRDFGTFNLILERDQHTAPIESHLALVTADHSEDGRRAEFRAVTSDGQRMRLIPRR